MADLWVQHGENGHWNPCFSRPLNDWEVDEVGDLFVKLQGKAVDMAEEDKMVWMNLHNLNFSMKLLYATLESRVIMSFTRQVIWNLWVPSKVNFFAWEAIWGKVLTLDQLQKRGWSLINRCFFCKEEEEFINHIFLHCFLVKFLWQLVFDLFGIH